MANIMGTRKPQVSGKEYIAQLKDGFGLSLSFKTLAASLSVTWIDDKSSLSFACHL